MAQYHDTKSTVPKKVTSNHRTPNSRGQSQNVHSIPSMVRMAFNPSFSNAPIIRSQSVFSLSSACLAFQSIHSSTLIFFSGLERLASTSATLAFSLPLLTACREDGDRRKMVSRSTPCQGWEEVRLPAMMLRFDGETTGVCAMSAGRGDDSWTSPWLFLTSDGRDDGGRFSTFDDCEDDDGDAVAPTSFPVRFRELEEALSKDLASMIVVCGGGVGAMSIAGVSGSTDILPLGFIDSPPATLLVWWTVRLGTALDLKPCFVFFARLGFLLTLTRFFCS